MRLFVALCTLAASLAPLFGQTSAPAIKPPPAPPRPPTMANVPYGSHERQVLDFYKATSAKPTPLLFFIHGGGWVAGDKAGVKELNAKVETQKVALAKVEDKIRITDEWINKAETRFKSIESVVSPNATAPVTGMSLPSPDTLALSTCAAIRPR